MRIKRLFVVLVFVFCCSTFASGQTTKAGNKSLVSEHLRSSAAFATLLLRRTELESTLEEMLVSYTEEYPKVKETRFELGILKKDIERLSSVEKDDSAKLTEALAKLLIRKATVATDHWVLLNRFNDEHPQVKRAKRKLEIFTQAIDEIL